jgi:polysaccharide deacetylase 2 family uncharacterized protein YibQ
VLHHLPQGGRVDIPFEVDVSSVRHGLGRPNAFRVFGFTRTSLLLLVFLQAVFVSSCGWFAPKRLTESERRQIAGHFKEVIEHTGGFEVWIKTPPYAPFPPSRAEVATEALAVSGAFDAVLSAVKQAAGKEGLEVKTRMTRAKGGRLADIRLAKGRYPAGRWRLREVGQLRRAAVVIDDLGQDLEAVHKLLALPYPLTFSVLPHLRYSAATAVDAHNAGREVMLHLPMEPATPARPGKGEIKVGMGRNEVRRILRADLSFVPHAAGVNNHMGSLATTDPKLMAAVMDALAEHQLYFVDSRTTAGSVALDVARRRGLPAFYRSVFLDDIETVHYTLGQLREFRRVIEEQGAALAIGHPYPTTLAALARFIPELEKDDIQLVPASQLVRLPEVARLTPRRATGR